MGLVVHDHDRVGLVNVDPIHQIQEIRRRTFDAEIIILKLGPGDAFIRLVKIENNLLAAHPIRLSERKYASNFVHGGI
jgi:hypothetical protein